MEFTITELFLFAWALFATLAAGYFHEMVQISKRFTLSLLDNPDLYKDITAKLNAHREKHNGNRI